MGENNSDFGRASDDESSKRELVAVYQLGPSYGTVGSYLWVADASSSDIPDPNSGTSRVDTIIAIPVLHWSPSGNSIQDQVAVRDQTIAVDAIEIKDGGLPFATQPPAGLLFSLEDNKLTIRRDPGTAGIFGDVEWPIEDRLAWYLNQSGTLSLLISDGSTSWVATAISDQTHPVIAYHKGTIRQRNFEQIINRSESWAVGALGNMSLAADMREVPDDHYDIYVSDERGSQLPNKLQHVGGCLSCGRGADSREHCTPNWIARDQGVKPVTAHLFCVECNNYFGENLEKPIAAFYRDGELAQTHHSKLFAQWAIKTALTLSNASGVRLQHQWMHELRSGHTPNGFEVFVTSGLDHERPGYMFGTTMMSAARHETGAFLATFSMPRLTFVVTRSEPPLETFGPFPRVHPSPCLPAETPARVDLTDLHGQFLKAITGQPVRFTPKPGRKRQHRN